MFFVIQISDLNENRRSTTCLLLIGARRDSTSPDYGFKLCFRWTVESWLLELLLLVPTLVQRLFGLSNVLTVL